jgi:hypothetical protein
VLPAEPPVAEPPDPVEPTDVPPDPVFEPPDPVVETPDPVVEPRDPAVPDPPEPEVALVPAEPAGIVELLSSPPQCAAAIAANAIDGTIHHRMFMSPPAKKSTISTGHPNENKT